jgi:hypothetical protein
VNTYLVLRLVHIMFIATWFGVGLMLPGDIRRTLARGRPHVDSLPERMKRVGAASLGSGVVAIMSGLGLIHVRGGFAVVAHRIHAGLALGLVLLGLGVAGFFTRRAIAKVILDGGDLSPALALAKRNTIFNGLEQTLWLAILALMVLPLF